MTRELDVASKPACASSDDTRSEKSGGLATVNAGACAALKQACSTVLSPAKTLSITDETNLFVVGLDSIAAIRLAFELKRKGWAITSGQILASTGKVYDISTMLKPISVQTLSINADAGNDQNCVAVSEHAQAMEKNKPVKAKGLQHSDLIVHQLEGAMDASHFEAIHPVSAAQLALIAATLRHGQEPQPSDPPYCARYTLSLASPADPGLVRQASLRLVQAHAALRTGFLQSTSGVVQVIRKSDDNELLKFGVTLPGEALVELPPLHTLFSLDAIPPVRFHLDNNRSVLILDLHHAVFDGWSLSLLLDDLYIFLTEPQLESIHHFDTISSPFGPSNTLSASDTGFQFWSSILDKLEPCNWPPSQRNDDSAPIATQRVSTTWNCPSYLSFLRAKFAATPSSVVRAALALALHLHSTSMSSSTIAFSAVSSGRSKLNGDQLANLVGCCVVTLPVVVDVDSAATVQELVSQVSEQHVASLEHEYDYNPSSFSNDDGGEMARLPQQCLLTFQNFPKGDRPDTQLQIVSQSMVRDYCLCLDALPRKDDSGIDFELHYDHDLISEQEAVVFLQHLCRMLDLLICTEGAEQVATLLSSMSPDEAAVVLQHSIRGKDTSSEHSLGSGHLLKGDNILEMVCNVSRRVPQKIALMFEESEFMTYHEFDKLTSLMASALILRGVQPGECVFVSMERGLDQILAIYTILKAGATFSPLDPSFPRHRKELLVKLASAKVILVDRTKHLVGEDPTNAESVNLTDLRYNNISKDESSKLLADRWPALNDVAYLLFTSGTTGTPKPVEVQHKALASFVRATEVYRQAQTSRRLAVAAFTFDVSVHDWAGALAHGSTLCTASTDTLLGDITSTLNKLRITMAQMTPTVANFIRPNQVDHLEILILSGEPVTKSCRDTFAKTFRFFNSFGPTETTVDVCSHDFENAQNDFEASKRFVPIGKPLGDSEIYIVDPKTLKPRPLLCAGEIVIGGPQVARGYRGLEEQTRKCFVDLALPNATASKVTTRRFYRTGDIGRLHPDGLFEHLGRIDSQVKIKGRRIEVEEIENVISEILADSLTGQESDIGTIRVCVDAIEDSVGAKALAAWISSSVISSSALSTSRGNSNILHLSPAARPKSVRLIESLRSRLPTYMVPSEIFFLQALPITPSGKTDRRALLSATESLRQHLLMDDRNGDLSDRTRISSEPRSACPPDLRSARPPRTRQASLLCQAFTHILRQPIQCETADFTAIGGDSIAAIKVLGHLRSLLSPGEPLPLTHSHLFRYKTVGALAEYWIQETSTSQDTVRTDQEQQFHSEQKKTSGDTSWRDAATQFGIDPTQVQEAFPATQLQEALLSLSLKDGSSYLAEFRWRLIGSIDDDRIMTSWRGLILRHPILRSVFVPCDSGVYQLVLSPSVYNRLTFQGFEWGKPLHSGSVSDDARCAEKSFILRIHHALYDGWSLNLLLADLAELYHSDSEMQPSMKERPSFSIVARHEAHSQALIESDLRFWQKQLEHHVVPSWPAPPSASFCAEKSERVVCPIPGLRHGLAWHGLTLGSAIAAALTLVLSKYSESDDILFDVVTSGRTGYRNELADIGSIVGPCVAVLPFRLQVKSHLTLSFLAKSALELLSDVLDKHNSSGMAQITKTVRDNHTGHECKQQQHLPLSSVLLTMSSDVPNTSPQEKLLFQGEPTSSMRRNYSVCLDVSVQDDSLHFHVGYDEAVFIAEDARHLALHVAHTLQQILECRSDTKVSTFKLFGPPDAKILQAASLESRARQQRLMAKPCLLAHEYLERHAAQIPNKIAIQYGQRFWTYADVWSRAKLRSSAIRSTLLTALHQRGQPLPLVPILTHKDDEFVVNCFAVMIAGGAYVPIDPQWPLQRKLHVLQETSASLVLLGKKESSEIAITDFDDLKSFTEEKGISVMTVEELEMAASATKAEAQRGFDEQSKSLQPDLAYVLFTSGTSGKPKGVQVQASNLAAFLQGALDLYPQQNCWSRRGSFASHTFDVSCHDIFGSVAAGSCLCLAPTFDMRLDLQHTLQKLRVSLIQLTPSVAKIISIAQLPCLQALITSGEALPISLIEAITQHVPLFNSNGPTEATVDYSSRFYKPKLTGEVPVRLPWVSVGKPIGMSRYFVVDENEQPCAIGQKGEVVVVGPQVAKGYLNMHEQTSQSFRHSLPLEHGYKRYANGHDLSPVYFTGDVGVLHANGELQLIGRKDGQVKINGLRIELEEINAVLERCIHVAAAATFVNSDQKIITFVAAETDTSVPQEQLNEVSLIEALLEQARAALPGYMIPARVIVLHSALPVTSSGKIDKARLMTFDSDRSYSKQASCSKLQENANGTCTAPSSKISTPGMPQNLNESQTAVRRVWAEVLGLQEESIGIYTSWQATGGDSIQLIRLYSAARRHGLQLPTTAEATIAAQALGVKFLHSAQRQNNLVSPTGQTESPQQRSHEESSFEVVPLSPMQRHFLSKTGPLDRYAQSMLLRLDSTVDSINSIRACLSILVHKHAQLRCTFSRAGQQNGSSLIQTCLPASKFASWPVEEVGDCSTSEQVNKLMDRALSSLRLASTSNGKVDDSKLLCGLLFSYQGTSYLFLAVHHLLIDLVSWDILLHDLDMLLKQRENERMQMATTSSNDFSQSFASFVEELDIKTSTIPLYCVPNYTRVLPKLIESEAPTPQTYVSLAADLPPFSLTEEIKQRHGYEIADCVLAMFADALFEVASTKAPVIAFESHGRDATQNAQAVADTVGWFTLVAPLHLQKGTVMEETLQLVRSARLADVDLVRAAAELAALAPGSCSRPRWPLLLNIHAKTPVSQEGNGSRRKVFEVLTTANSRKMGLNWLETDPNAVRDAEVAVEVEQAHDGFLHVEICHRDSCSADSQTMKRFVDAIRSAHTRVNHTLQSLQHKKPSISRASLLPHIHFTPQDWEHFKSRTCTLAHLKVNDIEDVLPITPMQESLVLESQRIPGAYITSRTFRVASEYSAEQPRWRIQEALKKLTDLHPALLRSRFVIDGKRSLVLVVLRSSAAQPCLFTISDGAINSLTAAPKSLGDPLQQPFGVKMHFDQNNGDMLLTMVIHHSLIDAWSMQLLLQDFEALLRDPMWQPTTDRPAFRSYLTMFAAQDRTQTREYWSQLLKEVLPLSSRPFDDRLADMDSQQAASMQRVQAKVKRSSLCRTSHTLATSFILSWAAVLTANAAGKANLDHRAVMLGLVHNGRDPKLAGIEAMVGPTVTTLPLPVLFRGDWNLETLLGQLHRTLHQANQNCNVGLNELMSWTKLRPKDICSFVTFRNLSGDDGKCRPDAKLEEIAADDCVQIPLSISAGPSGSEDIWIELLHNSNVFSRSEAQKLLGDTIKAWQMLMDLLEKGKGEGSSALLSSISRLNNIGCIEPSSEAAATTLVDSTERHTRDTSSSISQGQMVASLETSNLVKKLQEIWTRVFDVQQGLCPANIPFTELGGSSLMAMRLMAEMREAGFNFRVADLLKPSSILDLVNADTSPEQRLEQDETRTSPSAPENVVNSNVLASQCPPALPEDIDLAQNLLGQVERWYVCPPTQQALLAVAQTAGGEESQAYVAKLRFKANVKHLQPERLQQAFALLTKRHEILRTAFVHSRSLGFVAICYHSHADGLPQLLYDHKGGNAFSRLHSEDDKVPWQASIILDRTKGLGTVQSVEWEMHHALYDGVTVSIFLQELDEIYEQLSVSFLPPAVPYSRFAARIAADAEALGHQSRQYWAKRLENMQSSNWPCNWKGQTLEGTNPGVTKAEVMASSDYVDIEAAARHLGVLPAVIVRLAVSLLISKLSSSDQVTFDWVSSGRERPGLENTAGPTIVTYPTRVDVPLNMPVQTSGTETTLSQLLSQIQDDLIDEMRHSHLGKRDILRTLGPAGTLSMNQVLVTYQPSQQSSEGQRGKNLVPVGACMSLDYVLSLEITPKVTREGEDLSRSSLVVNAAFDSSLISTADAQIFVEQLVHLFEQLASAEHAQTPIFTAVSPIQALTNTGMPKNEQRLVESLYSAPKIAADHLPLIHELVLAQEQRTPSKIALQFQNDFVTYRELVERAKHVSILLQAACPAAERVGICMNRGADTIVAMLGVLMASAAYVPIDPDLPSARCTQIAKVAAIQAVIVSHITCHVLESETSNLGVKMLFFEDLVSRDGSQACYKGNLHSSFHSSALPQSLAYIIPTSGSTGVPKACAINHSNATAFLTQATHYYCLGVFDKKLQAANFAFDVSVFDIWGTLSVGGCVVGAPKEDMFGDMAAIIRETSCTFLDLTPTVASLLCPADLPSVHSIILGGESLSRPLLHLWLDAGTIVFNASSPSECVVNVLAHRFTKDNSPSSLLYIPIGRPLGYSRIFILNRWKQHVRIGEVGEIYIGGPQVGAGYFGDATKTDAAFLNDVEIQVGGQHILEPRLFRSGDMAVLHGDGLIEHLGRQDGQTKLNGLRIELGDIETCLLTHFSVRRACVLKIAGVTNRQDRLVAFVERNVEQKEGSEEHDLEEALRFHAREKLPTYMIPEQIEIIESLPTTLSGKVDRKLLQERACRFSSLDGKTKHSRKSVSDGPADELERKLVQMCCEVLQTQQEETSMEVPWSHLGGDSISSIHMISRCRRDFGVKIGFGKISRSTTLRKIGTIIREQLSRKVDEPTKVSFSTHSHQRSNLHRSVPLTRLQRRFWTLFRSKKELDCFSQSHLVVLPKRGSSKPWSASELQEILRNLQRRYQSLRCKISDQGMHPVDIETIEAGLVQVQFRELFSLAQAQQECEDTIQRLSLKRGHLLAATLMHFQGDDALFVAAHHFVVDIVSWGILLEDIEALLKDPCAQLPDATDSFLLWAEEEEQQNRKESASIRPKPLWQDTTCRDPVTSHRLLTEFTCHAVCSQLGIDPEELLLGALLIALHETIPLPDDGFTLAVEGHGREPWKEQQDLTRSVGWYSIFYPIDVQFDNINDLRESLRQARDSLLLSKKQPGTRLPESGHLWPVVFNYHGSNSLVVEKPRTLSSVEWNDGGHGVVRDAIVNIEVSSTNQAISWLLEGPSALSGELEKVSARLAVVLDRIFAMTSAKPVCPPLGLSIASLETFEEFTRDEYRDLIKNDLPRIGLEPWHVERVSHCTALQEALVAAGDESDRYRGIKWYNVADDKLFASQLKAAWQIAVSRIEILRSAFVYHATQGLLRLTTTSGWKEPLFLTTKSEDKMKDWIQKQGHPTYSPVAAAVLENEQGFATKFVMVVHHALTDAWSMDLLESDLERIMVSTTTSQASSPASAPVRPGLLGSSPSFDAVVQFYKSKDQGASRLFWEKQLSTMEPVEWPRIGSSNVKISSKYLRSRCKTEADFNLTECANEARKKHGISIADVFQMAWAILLHRRSWQEGKDCDVSFGLVLAGRAIPVERIEAIHGPCLQIALARYRFNSDDSIVQTLKALQTQQDQWAEHAYVGLSEMLSASGRSSLDHLYHTLASFRNLPGDLSNQHRPRKLVQSESDDRISVPISVSAFLDDSGNRLEFDVLFDEQVLDPQDANHLVHELRHTFEQLYQGISMDSTFGTIQAVCPSQLKLLDTISEVKTSTQGPSDLVSIFLRQVTRTPQKIFCQQGEAFITYFEMERLTRHIAHRIQQHCKDQGQQSSLIPVRFVKQVRVMVVILSILRAGFGYISIDPELPAERQSFIISQVRPSILIEDQHKYPQLQVDWPLRVIKLSSLELDSQSQYATTTSSLEIPAKNAPCYAVYTSGSTGRPKGCLVHHSNAAAYCLNYPTSEGVPTRWTDRMLSISNPGFDASICEYFVTLGVGGTICFESKDAILSDLVGLLQRYRITTGFMTPSFCRTANLAKEVPHITHLALGGEPVPYDDVLRLIRGGIRVFNVYGPTETTVMVLTTCLTEETIRRYVPIGTPIPGTRAKILDGSGRRCPIGVPGEIVIGGPQVTAGYIDLHSDAFYTSSDTGERFYRTGDWGALCADGMIRCFGRRDGQIKLRGLRIELGDITSTIRSVEGVDDAAVVVWNDTLVAAYTLKPLEHTSSDEIVAAIQRRCDERLPSYSVPSSWICIEDGHLPRTANGKFDSTALKSIIRSVIGKEKTHAEGAAAKQDPDQGERKKGSALEETIAQAWSLALNVSAEKISLSHSFARLGGDSIKAVRVAAHLRKCGLKHVSVAAILRCKTIEAYARHLSEIIQTPAALISDSRQDVTLQLESDVSTSVKQSGGGVLRKSERFKLLQKSRRTAFSETAHSTVRTN